MHHKYICHPMVLDSKVCAIVSVHRIGNEYLSHYFIRSKLKYGDDLLVDLCWRLKYPIRCRKEQRREGEMGESA